MNKCNCFIRKSTKLLTDFVYRLGGRKGDGFWHSKIKTLLIVDEDKFYCLDDECYNAEHLIAGGFFDCGENEELFLALSSLGSKTPMYTNGDSWEFGPINDMREATKEEIINHFNH